METKNNIQFYADKENSYTNKFFSFPVFNEDDAFRLLLHFHCRGNKFRAIYYKTVLKELTVVINNSIERYDYYNFFKQYDSSHFPSLTEAKQDYELYLM